MIQTIYTPNHYVGTGLLTNYAFTWRILRKTDLVAITRDEDGVVTVLTLDSDYTIANASVNNSAGGEIVLDVELPDGVELFLNRSTAMTQLVNIQEGAAFPSSVIIEVFDRLTMMIQELKYLYRQSLHFAPSSTFADIEVPDPENGTVLGWEDELLVNTVILGDKGDEESIDENAETFDVVFDVATSNANYEVVTLTTNWNTTADWSDKTTAGFTVTFGTPAPADAKLVWRILQR